MTGRAGKALDDAIARTLGVLRIFGVVHALVTVLVWRSWYSDPTHLLPLLIAAGWSAVFAVNCFRVGLTKRLAAGDFGVSLLLAASSAQALAPDALDRGPNWLLFRLVGTSVAVAWCAPVWIWLLGTGVLVTAVAASYLSAEVPAGLTLGAVVLVVVASVLLATASKVPLRGARDADIALELVGARRHAQTVAAMRHRDRREAERVLHDTVLNTLTGLGWVASDPSAAAAAPGLSGDPDDMVRARCRQSVALCTDFLAGEDDLETDVGLARRLEDVVEQARRDGLRLDMSATGDLDVPARVGGALVAAAREALSNVRRHSGTSRAWLDVRGLGGEVRLTVRDEGVGFDPLATAPDRLGLRNSIMERIADVGGSADVRSTPGRGTTVEAYWSPHPAPDLASLAQTTLLDATYARDALRSVGLGALVWQGGLGLLLAWRIDHYQRPLVVVGTWALSLLALAWCVAVAFRGAAGVGSDRDWARARARAMVAVTAAVVAAQLAAGLSAPHGDLPALSWTVLVAAGPVCFVGVGRPVREWLPAAAVMVGTALALALVRDEPTAAVVGRLAGSLYVLVAAVTALTMFWRSRRATIGVTVGAARAEVDLAAERAAAVAARRERGLRLRQLAEGPLPLLTGIGTGRLDPADQTVRRECAARASALRRTLTRELTRSSAAPGGLLAALEPAVLAAEQRGASVEVQVSCDVNGMPVDVERRVVRLADRVLAGVGVGRVLVTVVGDTADGSLILSFPATVPVPAFVTAEDAEPGAVPTSRRPGEGGDPPSDGRRIEVVQDAEDGQVCVEIRWGLASLNSATS